MFTFLYLGLLPATNIYQYFFLKEKLHERSPRHVPSSQVSTKLRLAVGTLKPIAKI